MMKRILALILAAVAIFAFAACTESGKTTAPASTEAGTTPTGSAPAKGDTTPAKTEPAKTEPAKSDYNDATAVLDAIWNQFTEDELFPVLGGNREAMVENKPGAFDLSAAEEMTSSLLIPQANIGELKSAASLVHMMNGNTFTSAVFQTDGNLDDLSQVLVDAANAKQFICGAPQVLVTLKVDNYLIMAFGTDDLTETFQNHALEVEGVSLIHSGPIVFNGGNAGGSGNGGAGGFGGVIIPM